MRKYALLIAAFWLGGCVSDGPGIGGVAAPATASATRIDADPDAPKQVCVDTSEGTQGKTVCY